MASANTISLLQEGVAAAKAGDASTARRLLQKSTELYPQSEMAWFWLAYVSDDPQDKVNSLKRVLEINPEQTQARTVLKRALLQSGINAAKAGDRAQARRYLTETADLDPTNELVWMWMASVSENPNEALRCVHKTLALNPQNERAQSWLAKLQPSTAGLPKPVWQCPFCLTTSSETKTRCPKCQAIATLADMELAWENTAVDRGLLERAIERDKSRHAGNGDFAAHAQLALAYLNVNQPAAALEHLRNACALQPENQTAQRQLQRLSERLAPPAAPQPPAPAYEPTPTYQPAPEPEAEAQRVILLVDDSPTIRKLVAVTLERQGYRVIVAAGGMEALAKLNETVPDFILLDISMPHMDGYQLCKLIKTNAMTRQVPVVMLSGKDGFFDKVRGRMAGANDYLTKPFDPTTLVQVIEKHCPQNA